MESSSLSGYLVRHQQIARAMAVAVAAVVLLGFATWPLIVGINEKSRKIDTREKEEKSLVEKVSLLSELDPNVLDERLAILDLALPPRKDVVAYLAAVDGLSRELGLSFGGLSLSPGEVTEQGMEEPKKTKSKRTAVTGLQTLDTSIKMRGTQGAIYTFLKSVESTLPLMLIKDVKVTAGAEEEYSLSLSLTMLWAPASAADVKGAVSLFNEQEESYFQTLAEYRSYKSELESDAGLVIDEGRADIFGQVLSVPEEQETN